MNAGCPPVNVTRVFCRRGIPPVPLICTCIFQQGAINTAQAVLKNHSAVKLNLGGEKAFTKSFIVRGCNCDLLMFLVYFVFLPLLHLPKIYKWTHCFGFDLAQSQQLKGSLCPCCDHSRLDWCFSSCEVLWPLQEYQYQLICIWGHNRYDLTKSYKV